MNEVREGILGKLERIRERDAREKLAAGWTRDGDDWVPPGYARVVDVKALPVAEEEPGQDVQGPRVRRL